MIIVHHLEESRSLRVLWLLEELELDYDVRHYKRDPATRLAPPELREIHPLGKSPIVVDDGEVFAETGAVVEYLIDRYGGDRLRPDAATPQRRRYSYWLHYAEGSAMPPLLMGLVLGRGGEAAKPAMSFVAAQIKLHFDYVDAELAKSNWFAGDEFSAADIMMSFPLERAARLKDTNTRPRIVDFVERIRSRAAYKRAVSRGEAED
jgi:glutathione S-transferase